MQKIDPKKLLHFISEQEKQDREFINLFGGKGANANLAQGRLQAYALIIKAYKKGSFNYGDD